MCSTCCQKPDEWTLVLYSDFKTFGFIRYISSNKTKVTPARHQVYVVLRRLLKGAEGARCDIKVVVTCRQDGQHTHAHIQTCIDTAVEKFARNRMNGPLCYSRTLKLSDEYTTSLATKLRSLPRGITCTWCSEDC